MRSLDFSISPQHRNFEETSSVQPDDECHVLGPRCATSNDATQDSYSDDFGLMPSPLETLFGENLLGVSVWRLFGGLERGL